MSFFGRSLKIDEHSLLLWWIQMNIWQSYGGESSVAHFSGHEVSCLWRLVKKPQIPTGYSWKSFLMSAELSARITRDQVCLILLVLFSASLNAVQNRGPSNLDSPLAMTSIFRSPWGRSPAGNSISGGSRLANRNLADDERRQHNVTVWQLIWSRETTSVLYGWRLFTADAVRALRCVASPCDTA